jgi:hypothetical protein
MLVTDGINLAPIDLAERSELMGALEILIVVAFFASFLCVRFGIPLGICWLIGLFDRRYLHPQA